MIFFHRDVELYCCLPLTINGSDKVEIFVIKEFKNREKGLIYP